MRLVIAPLTQDDRDAWDALARGYKAFYKTEHTEPEYDVAWRRLLEGDGVFALGAQLNGTLVGITHYLFHTTVWADKVCYLQDLFVDPSTRGKGVARALIEAVAAESRKNGAKRLYWTTQDHNATARALYDKVAKFNGFIRYDFSL